MIVGTGIDIVEIARIQAALERTPKLYERILTEEERKHIPNAEQRRLEYIAGRFAAKEAIAKALGVGIGKDFSWHDVSILHDENGKPTIVDHRELLQQWKGHKCKIHLSIAHEHNYATAMAIMETES